jgi:hypothetical protein
VGVGEDPAARAPRAAVPGARYRFTDDWYVAADPAATADLVGRTRDWPSWWPSSLGVEPVPPRVAGAPDAARYTFSTRLPYRMVFQADVVRRAPTAVETVVVGRVRGAGRWEVTPVPGGSRVHFDWSVDPQVAWMRAVAPLARPLFVWNHRAVMAEGAHALADRLGVAVLRPPACTPSVAAAGARLAVGLALLGALALVLRQALGPARGSRRGPGPAGRPATSTPDQFPMVR